MQLSDFKTATKLVTAFVLVALIGAVIGAFALYNMKRIDDADTRLYEQELIGLSLMKEANVERLRGVVALRDAMIATTGQEREEALQRQQQARQQVAALLDKAAPLFVSEASRQGLEQLRKEWANDEKVTAAMNQLVGRADLATST
jgi:hypothetical protein